MLRFAWLIAVWLTVTALCLSQELLIDGVAQERPPGVVLVPEGPVVRLRMVPNPACDPESTGDDGSVSPSPAGDVKRLLADLPGGWERDIALKLLDEVSVGSPSACLEEPYGREFVADSIGGTGAESDEIETALGNRSLPVIGVFVAAGPGPGEFSYRYRVGNGANATAPVTTWGLMAPPTDRSLRRISDWQTATTRTTYKFAAAVARESTQTALDPKHSAEGISLSGWTALSDQQAIPAGSSRGLFSVVSAFRPGWTIAYVGFDSAIQFPQQPQAGDVEVRLEVQAEPESQYTSVLTIGPKFGPGTDRTRIAADWHMGIQKMIADGQLLEGSPYVTGLLGALARIGRSAPGAQLAMRIGTPPEGAMETILDKTIRMALK